MKPLLVDSRETNSGIPDLLRSGGIPFERTEMSAGDTWSPTSSSSARRSTTWRSLWCKGACLDRPKPSAPLATGRGC